MSNVKDLKSSSIKGSLWTTLERFSLQGIQFVIGIILARLLDPNDFGLIAITTIFITISGAITDGGFEKALIQKKELSDDQINTAFYINVLLGIIMAGIIYLLSPSIASFFNEPRLIPIFRVLALTLPLEALSQIQRTLLMKELKFKKISIGQILGTFLGSAAGVYLAYAGYGVWSLVYSTLIAALIKVLVFWFRSDWYPKLIFSYSSISNIVPFGLNVLASSILFFFLQQFNNFIVGKYFSKTDLGLFNRGSKFPEIITGTIQSIVLKLSLPLFSKIQDDNEQMKHFLNRTNGLVAFVSFPFLGFLFIHSEQVTVFLLTDKWIGSAIYLKLFCLVKIWEPFISVQRELLLAKGKANLLLRIFLFISLIEIVPMILLVEKGIIYIVWIGVIAKAFQFLTYQFIVSKVVKQSILVPLRIMMTYSGIIAIVIAALYLVDYLLPYKLADNILVQMSFHFSLGGFLYALLCIAFKTKEMDLSIQMFSSSLLKLKAYSRG